MDRKDPMTQYLSSRIRAGHIVLAFAVIVLGFAIGYAVRNSGPAPAATAAIAPAQGGNADPIATLEQRARDNPADAEALTALGAAYFDSGRFAEAATTYEKATKLKPETAGLWSALGEAQVMASARDPMPAAAAASFTRAASLDAKDPRARYFLAVKRDLTGDHAGAIDDWLALLADSPAGAPWESDLRRTIEQVGKINKIDVAPRLAAISQPAPTMPVATRGIPGPTSEDLRAASAIPPSEQKNMAETMVARLEGRLKDNPKNVDGWIMLVRSRVTLGEPDKAAKALRDGVAANPESATKIREQSAMLGVK